MKIFLYIEHVLIVLSLIFHAFLEVMCRAIHIVLSPPKCTNVQIHTQWFAAEDEGRTFDPTEHKRRKSREEGRVAKTPDIPSVLILFSITLLIAMLGKYYMTEISAVMHYYFSGAFQGSIVSSSIVSVSTVFYQVIKLILPVLIVSVLAAFLGNTVQFGFLFATKPVTPDFSKIVPNFSKWMENTFFSTFAIYNLFKSILKVILIGAVLVINIWIRFDSIVFMFTLAIADIIREASWLIFWLLIQESLLLFALSLIDFQMQKIQYTEQLKMTREEFVQEQKETEGDANVRRRIQRRYRELIQQNMIREVPNADVVVTNPTHFAVALQYEIGKSEAPIVKAKGADHIARRIKDIAKQHDIPIIENKPLARALYAELQIGDIIPEKYFKVVSLIFKQVYEMKGKTVV